MRSKSRRAVSIAAAALSAALVLSAAPVQAQSLTIEVSAEETVRDRLLGQLVDLDVRISELRRPSATLEELENGDAELCIFVRVDAAVTLGLIDRRGGLAQRTGLPDASTVSIETAALQVREWTQEILREDAVRAAEHESADDSDDEPERDDAPREAPSPVQASLALSAGWHMIGLGADAPFQGAWLGVGAGRSHPRWSWRIGLRGAFSTAQRWRREDVAIEHARFRVSLWASAARHWGAFDGDLRMQLGVLGHSRETLDAGAGRVPTPDSRSASAFIAASVGTGVHVYGGLAFTLRIGAELALDRQEFQAQNGPRFSPWWVRPIAEAGLRFTWPA